MSLVKNNIVVGLSLTLLLTVNAAVAITENTNPLTGAVNAPVENRQGFRQRSGGGNPIAGEEKSQLCQGCHGEFGNSTVSLIPKLAGQYAKYISKQVRDYQTGVRSHQIMNAMAATLSDSDLADVAAYFASQKKMKGERTKDNRLGKELFLQGDPSKMRLACVNCHGVNGKGLDAKISMFPVIGGQHKDYLRKQLVDFRENFRTNSPSGIMNTVASTLSDDEIEALAEYVSRL
jgi:cytochrome c553